MYIQGILDQFNSIDKIQNLAILFIIYSFAGWVLESVVKTFIAKKFVNSGFLYGPVCPIYGFGALGIILFINPFKGKYLLILLMSFFIMSLWEYIVGVWLEKKYKTSYWDYSDRKCNINGKVCLGNSLFWALLGLVFVEFMHPFIASKVEMLSSNIKAISIAISYLIFLIDVEISNNKVNNINTNLLRLENLVDRIKEKIDELKDLKDKSKEDYAQKIQSSINELREKQAILIETIAKKTNRLRKAFPKMKSINFHEYLKLVNDNIKLRKDKKYKSK